MTPTLDDTVARVLGPVSLDSFFTQYWEAETLHIARARSGHFDADLELWQLESLLSTQSLAFPQVQLTQADRPVLPGEYCDPQQRIVPQRLLERHHAGATLVISQANELLPGLSALARYMSAALQMRCQTNIYLSPPGNQGFKAHYDAHDVFILQARGRKTFRVYESPVQLPTVHHGFDASEHSPGARLAEITLEPGDTLYIPRGVMHDAVAEQSVVDGALDGVSALHITLGVFPITVSDVLQEALDLATSRTLSLRRSVPWSSAHTPALEKDGSTGAVDVLSNVLNPALIDEATARLRDQFAVELNPDCHGALTTRALSPGSHDAASGNVASAPVALRLCAGAILNHERRGARLRVRTFGQVLEFDAPMSDAVQRLIEQGRLDISEWRELSDGQRVALSDRLCATGLASRCS